MAVTEVHSISKEASSNVSPLSFLLLLVLSPISFLPSFPTDKGRYVISGGGGLARHVGGVVSQSHRCTARGFGGGRGDEEAAIQDVRAVPFSAESIPIPKGLPFHSFAVFMK